MRPIVQHPLGRLVNRWEALAPLGKVRPLSLRDSDRATSSRITKATPRCRASCRRAGRPHRVAIVHGAGPDHTAATRRRPPSLLLKEAQPPCSL
jgi:hypothetical protein